MSDVTEHREKTRAIVANLAVAVRAAHDTETVMAFGPSFRTLLPAVLDAVPRLLAAIEAAERVRAEPLAPNIIGDPYPPDRATWEGRNRQLDDLLDLQNELARHFGWSDRWRDGDPPLTEGRMLALVIAEVAQAREAGRREGLAEMREAAASCAGAWRHLDIGIKTAFHMSESDVQLAQDVAAGIEDAIRALPEPGVRALPDTPTKQDAERPDAAEGG